MEFSCPIYPVGSKPPFDPYDGKPTLLIAIRNGGSSYMAGHWLPKISRWRVGKTENRDHHWPTHFARPDFNVIASEAVYPSTDGKQSESETVHPSADGKQSGSAERPFGIGEQSITTSINNPYGQVFSVTVIDRGLFRASISAGSTENSDVVLTVQELGNLALRMGATLADVATMLIGTVSGEPWFYDDVKYLSIPDAIGQMIKRLIDA